MTDGRQVGDLILEDLLKQIEQKKQLILSKHEISIE